MEQNSTQSPSPRQVESAPKKVRTDKYIWGIYLFLVIISLIELYSASSQEVVAGNISGPLLRHGQFLVIGVILMLIIQHFHFKYIYYLTPIYVVATLIIMVLVLWKGTAINGAMRGLRIGPVFLLPAEMLKLAVALGISWIVARFQIEDSHDITKSGVWLCVIFVGISALLLFFHGLTNTLIVMAIAVTMMAVGFGGRKFWIIMSIFTVLGGAAIGAKTLIKSDKPLTPRQERIAELNKEEAAQVVGSGRGTVWNSRIKQHLRLNKYEDNITDENKQEQISYIAQANGGLFGVGIGKSQQNARLPLAYSDYIYAIVVEELGLFVAVMVLMLYVWLLMRAGHLSYSFKSTLPAMLVIGCGVVVVYQALFHIAIVTGVFPVSGQPLPLLSKGGTSVIVTSIALGVMLSVSRHASRKTDTGERANNDIENMPELAKRSNLVEI